VLLIALELICNIKYKVTGEQNLPKLPFIVASKHQSAFETILFWQTFFPPIYVLKKELLKTPFFGLYLWRLGMIYIDRQGQSSALKHMIIQAKNALNHQSPIILFPEGTRTTPGHRTNRYFPGITAIYSTTNVQIVPVALNSGLCWPGKKLIMKPGVVTVKILKPIQPGMDKDEFIQHLNSVIEDESLKLAQIDSDH
jgi:1-acyl-sn-glycerol-3-phosphate acyltransferase